MTSIHNTFNIHLQSSTCFRADNVPAATEYSGIKGLSPHASLSIERDPCGDNPLVYRVNDSKK